MATPFFTIIIPTYNRAKQLPIAIKSILLQSFSNWELIIIDDGSADNTAPIVTEFHEPRIRYYYQINQGRSAARNRGIELAKGQFICFLDSDDYYLPHHLSAFYQAIQQNDQKIGAYRSGLILKNGENAWRTVFFQQGDPIFFVLNEAYATAVDTYCIHRAILAQTRFEPAYQFFEDTQFIIRILLNYPLYQVEQHTAVCPEISERGTHQFYKNVIALQHNTTANIWEIRTFAKQFREQLSPEIYHYLQNEIISFKYVHHANGALQHRHFKIAITFITRAIKNYINPQLFWFYLKFFIKLPVKLLFDYPKPIQ